MSHPNLVGEQFGRLTVIRRDGIAHEKQMWLCRCVCGGETRVSTGCLRKGHSKSCGCLKREVTRARRLSHGATCNRRMTPEYRVWTGMVKRCTNKNCKAYPDYGGRGIAVCQKWTDSFQAFLDDVGPRPSARHTIERIDNEKGYEPGNVRWATFIEQANNTRQNNRITHGGRTQTIAQWARELGMSNTTLRTRLCVLKWPVAVALGTPAVGGQKVITKLRRGNESVHVD